MRRVVLVGAAALLAGCSESVSDLTCAAVEDDVVAISKGQLIKIVNSRETARTEDRLTCHGTGVYADGADIETRYQAYQDEDGEVMVMFDTDEAAARDEASAKAAIDREFRQDMQNLQRDLADNSF